MKLIGLILFLMVTASEAFSRNVVYWRESVSASETAFWDACKRGEVRYLQAKDGEATSDVATNVRAVQGDQKEGREVVYVTYG